MKIVVTGASGFLGRYILNELEGEVHTLGRSRSNSIQCNLDSEVPILPEVDMVIHNAGWAHRVPKTPEQERRFYEVNLFGTQNLLKGFDSNGTFPKAFVYISTVAVYGLSSGNLISEKNEVKPETPYARSKFEAELLLQKWAKKHQVNLTILRLPLIAGAIQTPGNLGAMIKAIQKGYYFRIGTGQARKSIVLAQDVARLLPRLNNSSGIFNLTDGVNPSIAQLEDYLGEFFGRKIRTIFPWFLKLAARVGDVIPVFPINSYRLEKLGESLTFDDSKARAELAWNPRPVIGNLDLEKRIK